MRVIVELIFFAILIVSVWAGYKKGLVMTVGSILIIIVSLFVGDLMSDTFSQEAIPALRPFVAGYMEGTDGAIRKALDEVTGGSSEMLSADDILDLRPEITNELCKKSFMNMGVYSSTSEVMAAETVEYYEMSGSSISASIVEKMCEKVTYYIGFILFFAVTVILLTVLGNISNLSFKIPDMEKLNTFGGAAAGLVVGIMYCMLAAWILKFAGSLLPENELWGIFSKLFVKMNTYSHFLTI